MKLTTDHIKVAQYGMQYFYKLKVQSNGVIDNATIFALNTIPVISTTWQNERRIIAFLQHMCAKLDINAGPVDGLWGPQTAYGWEQLVYWVKNQKVPEPWRDDEGIGATSTPTNQWPVQTQEALEAFYGPVGSNQVQVKVPYTLTVAWNTSQKITKFSCHEKVADSIVWVLDRVVDHYGVDKIKELRLDMWGGCLNVRPLRGGTRWSTHAWGIAIDWDPENNQLKWGKDKATLAQPIYNKWWDIWEEAGWVSLGRARNYDWMHVQAAQIK